MSKAYLLILKSGHDVVDTYLQAYTNATAANAKQRELQRDMYWEHDDKANDGSGFYMNRAMPSKPIWTVVDIDITTS